MISIGSICYLGGRTCSFEGTCFNAENLNRGELSHVFICFPPCIIQTCMKTWIAAGKYMIHGSLLPLSSSKHGFPMNFHFQTSSFHWFSSSSKDHPYLIHTSSIHLVGGLEHFLFSHILGMSSSQLTFLFFRGVGQPPTSPPYIAPGCLGSAHPLPRSHQHRSARATKLLALSSSGHDLAEAVSTGDGRGDQAVDLRSLAYVRMAARYLWLMIIYIYTDRYTYIYIYR